MALAGMMIRRNPSKSPVKTGMRDDLPDESVKTPTIRPRASASLIVIDRSDAKPRFLLGRRHDAHAFMPGKYVFPGGKLERGDARLPAVPLTDETARLLSRPNARLSSAHALAIAAVREAWEEAAISIAAGKTQPLTKSPLPFCPDLSALSYVARAITPPGFPRRYDTRFFAVFRDRVSENRKLDNPDAEMTNFGYFSEAETAGINLPSITRIILDHVCRRLEADPLLELRQPLPTFRTRRAKFVCDWH
jgi:8-oxo-dGTP pyrophosphatase MutT (NUDIX family)